MAVRESIGQRIARLRNERGLSQRQLAEGLDRVSYAFISRIENDDRRASDRTLRQIAKKLGTTPLFLETGSDDVVCPHCGRK